MNLKERFKQAESEARWSVTLTLLYLVGWSLGAYCLSSRPALFGFPLWFEVACIFVPVTFIILCVVMIYKKFRLISLDNDHAS